MKLTLFAIGALFAGALAAQQPLPIGTWFGDARLFNKEARSKANPIAFEIAISPNGSMSGTFAGSTFESAAPKELNATHALYVTKLLPGAKAPGLEGRDVLVLMVNRNAVQVPDIDFHLKRRVGFDPGMLVGHIDIAGKK